MELSHPRRTVRLCGDGGMKTIRAAIYTRISDDRIGDAAGVRRQEKECRELVARRGWEVAEVYSDNSTSAYSLKRKRPAYERMLDDIKNGQVDALVAWATDRLYRRYEDLRPLIQMLEGRPGFDIDTVRSGLIDLSTPAGRMVAGQLALVAEYESAQKAERIKAKHRQLAEDGRESGGGSRPYGYGPDRRTIVEAEAAMVTEAARRIIAGEPIRSVLRDWTRRGVPTSSGKAWTVTSLRRILTSYRTAGLRAHHGIVTAQGDWPALLDQETLARLRAILLAPERLTNLAGNARKYLLTGWATCGVCGARLVARPRRAGVGSYVCAKGPGFHGCGHLGVMAAPLEAYVSEAVFMAVDDEELVPYLRSIPDRAEDQLLVTVGEAEALIERLGAEYGRGEMSRLAFQAAERAAVARLEAARGALGRQTRRQVAGSWAAQGRKLRSAWPQMDLLVRRAILEGILRSVTVGPGVRGLNRFDSRRVSIQWLD